MLCAFMCSYSTLPMIGIDCGRSTDHFMRASLIGNGASPKCGMLASLATVDTAIEVGVGVGCDAPGIGGRGGGVAAIVEHDQLERHAADFLRNEVERVPFGNPER